MIATPTAAVHLSQTKVVRQLETGSLGQRPRLQSGGAAPATSIESEKLTHYPAESTLGASAPTPGGRRIPDRAKNRRAHFGGRGKFLLPKFRNQ
jgi:hypothetical protein